MSQQAGKNAGKDAGPVALRASEKPLCQAYDVALLDLDGVVYIGGEAIPGASQALRKAGDEGMRLAYVTNNANRTPAAVAEILNGFGISATREDVVTSAQAAARLLAERLPAGSAVLIIGGMGLRVALRERGLRPVSTAAERPAAVAQGYAPASATRCWPRAAGPSRPARCSSGPTPTARCPARTGRSPATARCCK